MILTFAPSPMTEVNATLTSSTSTTTIKKEDVVNSTMVDVVVMEIASSQKKNALQLVSIVSHQVVTTKVNFEKTFQGKKLTGKKGFTYNFFLQSSTHDDVESVVRSSN
jgi:hypothetical protein